MFSKARTGTPRHLAGSKRTAPARDDRAPVAVHLAADGDLAEVTPVARVHRSRLAFAVSATLAAVPIMVLDNFPATADTGPRSEVEAVAGPAAAERPRATSTTESPSTSSTAAAQTTLAPPAVDAASTSAAPDTTEAPEAVTLSAPASEEPSTTQAPPPTAAPAPAAEHSGEPGDPDDPATWDRLAQCESHGDWSLNTGNGYYGGLQFSLASWRDVGGSGYPHEHSREEQIRRGQILQARYGWGQWPVCSRELGYR